MPTKTGNKKIIFESIVGLAVVVLGVVILASTLSPKTKKTEASAKSWVQSNWSSGSGGVWFKDNQKKYSQKTGPIDDKTEGVGLNISEAIPAGGDDLGGGVVKGLKDEGKDGGENLGDEKINGGLISAIFDADETVIWENGKLEAYTPVGSTVNFYLKTGDLKDQSGIVEKNGGQGLNGDAALKVSDIKWNNDWVKFSSGAIKSGSLVGRFAQYKIELSMPKEDSESPRVYSVSFDYETAAIGSDADHTVSSSKSQVTISADSIQTGEQLKVEIQLNNKAGQVITTDSVKTDQIDIKLKGIEKYEFVGGSKTGVSYRNGIYYAYLKAKELGKASLEVSVKNSDQPNGEKNGSPAPEQKIILNNKPVIKFLQIGGLYSSVFDANSSVNWTAVDYTANVGTGATVSFDLAVSDNKNDLIAADESKEFDKIAKGVVKNSKLNWKNFKAGSKVSLKGRYLKYRVVMTTYSPTAYPSLEDLAITYEQNDGNGTTTGVIGSTSNAYTVSSDSINIDNEKSSVTATTPHRVGVDRSKIIVRLKDSDNNPIKNFPARRIILKTDPSLGTVFHQQMQRTDYEGRIVFECSSTITARKTLNVLIADSQGGNFLVLNDRPVIDFVGLDEEGVYLKSGELNSSFFDAKSAVDWEKISWIAELPEDANLKVMILAGNDLRSLYRAEQKIENWRLVENGEKLKFRAQYLKYKVLLNNDNPYVTPKLKNMKIEYNSAS